MRLKKHVVRIGVKRILSASLVASFLLAVPFMEEEGLFGVLDVHKIYASSAADRKEEAESELNDLNSNLGDLEDEQDKTQAQLSEKAQMLSDLMADQQLLESDIAKTQDAIDQAELDLAAAKEREQKEYEAMTLRIQYMYENSTQNSIWDAIIGASGITDMLNRVEYVNQVHKTDREMLEDYKEAVQEVETVAAELEMEMNDLVALQEVYEHQETELEIAMAELQEEMDDFEEQIAAAEARAEELAAYIEQQNRIIEAELLAQQQQNQNNNNNNDANKNPSLGTSGYLSDPSYDPAFKSEVSGDALVAYALQFVGNPYVWGGNSLTEGCDCSGFVNLIYRHFGFKNVPRYSQSFKYYGEPVAFQNLKAGDIVVYPGHVAIYIGNGNIVEAQSSRAGITSNRKVTCNTITGIRRVL